MKQIIFSLVLIFLISSIALADFPWITIFDEEGGDGGHLTVELDSTFVYEYVLYFAIEGGGTGYIADLEQGDIFIEFDEDPGHGNIHHFSFSGTYNDETPDFLQVSGTGLTNWTVHTVLTSGTLIKTNDCCADHVAIQLFFPSLTLTKTDDVNDGACIVPGDEVTYTICYSYQNEPNLPDINDVNIFDYLPTALEYISSDPPGNYSPQSQTVDWPVGTIRPGDTNCVTLTVKLKECITDCAVITNLCSIKSGDSTIKNNAEHTPLCVAGNPRPASGKTGTLYIGEPPDINLVWCPGSLASDVNGHDIYFGTDFNEVNVATTSSPQYKGRQSITSYPADGLEVGATYYWRVDEVNDPGVWRGTVWNFDTGFIIDDFGRYTSTQNLNDNWKTGLPVCFGEMYAGTGQLTLTSDNENKCMQFNYDKNIGSDNELYFSEAALVYGPDGVDWTYSGLINEEPKFLVISFKGAIGNSADPNYDRMYVAIEDTAGHMSNMVYHPDPNAQTIPAWQKWQISLSDLNSPDVNLKSVKNLYIGFGARCNYSAGYGGAGYVMFDNIQLTPPCLLEYGLDADLTHDCVVNSYDLSAFADDWLACGMCGRKTDIYPDTADGIVDFRDFAVLASKWLEEAP